MDKVLDFFKRVITDKARLGIECSFHSPTQMYNTWANTPNHQLDGMIPIQVTTLILDRLIDERIRLYDE